MYASDAYQVVAVGERGTIDRPMAQRVGPGRLPAPSETLRQATQLKSAFWEMGMHTVGCD